MSDCPPSLQIPCVEYHISTSFQKIRIPLSQAHSLWLVPCVTLPQMPAYEVTEFTLMGSFCFLWNVFSWALWVTNDDMSPSYLTPPLGFFQITRVLSPRDTKYVSHGCVYTPRDAICILLHSS